MATSPLRSTAVQAWLSRRSPAFLTLYTSFAAFGIYFAIYAYRRPFQVVEYAGLRWGVLDLKTALVLGQMVGYTLSKFASIKLGSEVPPARRALALLIAVALAEVSLFFFAFLPVEWKVLAIFVNGLPLGMVWGLIAFYLEGRNSSEVLFAALSCAFIVGSGVVKDVGLLVMRSMEVSFWWMPSVTGLFFFPLFLLMLWLLDQVPPPSAEDRLQRSERRPMSGAERQAFLRRFAFGLSLQLLFYFFVSAYRDVRDIFGIEILRHLGYADMLAVFTRTETLVALGSMAALALISLAKDNRRALLANYGMMIFGASCLGIGTFLLDAQLINGLVWVSIVGLGAFLMYIPHAAALSDRLVAASGCSGTSVFLMYLMDGVGYTGLLGVQLYKSLFLGQVSYFHFFRQFSYLLALFGIVALAINALYFFWRTAPKAPQGPPTL